MKQLAVISGKGGTGKTSLAASFAYLARDTAVTGDCDVDAPDLHLILNPTVTEAREFHALPLAVIDASRCTACGECEASCRFHAIRHLQVERLHCEGCGVCQLVCPEQAITMAERLAGHVYLSRTRLGPLVHASLLPGEATSGKLVTMVRDMASGLARKLVKEMVIIDGSPGIGCPVIASLTGSNLALVVTEPTLSGMHDLNRVLTVADHFGIDALVCINKYDLNMDNSAMIEDHCRSAGVPIAGRVPFDPQVSRAIVARRAAVELEGPASEAIKDLWASVVRRL